MRGLLELFVALKGSIIVSWRRGTLRVGLVGVLAAVAIAGATGGLWLVGDGAKNAGGPGNDGVAGERAAAEEGDDSAGGPEGGPARRGATPSDAPTSDPGAARQESSEAATAASSDADTADDPARGMHLPGSDPQASGTAASSTGAPVERQSSPTTVGPGDGASPSPSTPPTTNPAGGDPPIGPGSTTTTTTGTTPPPDDGSGGSDGGVLGGLLGGVLDLLALGG